MDAAVDQDRCVNELPNAGGTFHRAADIGEALQKIDVVEKSVAEAFRSRRKVDPGLFEDVLEIG